MSSIFYIIFSYISLSFLIVFLSLKLSDYIDLLDKKTNLSGAFLGAVLLAIVTSLPELFTSISSVLFLNESGMVIGNIIGSNSFDILILGVCILLFYNNYKKDKLDFKSHITVCVGLFAMYICLIVPLLLGENQIMIGTINICFLLVAVCYGVTLWRMPKKEAGEVNNLKTIEKGSSNEFNFNESKNKNLTGANVKIGGNLNKVSLEENKDGNKNHLESDTLKGFNLSVKQIVLRFCVCSVLLVGVSILITFATSDLADYFDLEKSTAGVLFLAIATSLPEVVSTISLCHKGNFDASFGNILGSCLFNTFVLTLSEFLYFKGSILLAGDMASIKLVLLNFVSVISAVVVLILKCKTKEFKWKRVLNYALSVILIACYVVYYVM